MPRYVQDKKTGKMKGAIPDSKNHIPTASPVASSDIPGVDVDNDAVTGTYDAYRKAVQDGYTRDTITTVADDLGVSPESLTEAFNNWRDAAPDGYEDKPAAEESFRYDLNPNAPQDAATQRALRKLGYEHYLATPYPVFVYGTLREGQGNSHLMSGARANTLPAEVNGVAIYGSTYGFPYASEHADETAVTQGEVVWLTDDENGETARAMLDHLEGFNSHFPSNSHYERVATDVTYYDRETGEESNATAWIYLARGSARQQLREEDRIEDGDWVKHQRRFELPDRRTYFGRF